jgi:hypothetical protein
MRAAETALEGKQITGYAAMKKHKDCGLLKEVL